MKLTVCLHTFSDSSHTSSCFSEELDVVSVKMSETLSLRPMSRYVQLECYLFELTCSIHVCVFVAVIDRVQG